MKFYCFFLIIFCNNLFCQKIDSITNLTKLESYIKLQYENDFFSATDRYYTQGIQFSFINKIIKHSPLSYLLISINKNAINYYGFNVEQNCFTPKSIRYDTLNYLERPFAATFFVSHTLNSLNIQQKTALNTQLDIGIIGPCAKCEDEQKAIHKALINIRPLGWENQLKTDYIINYRVSLEKGFVNQKHLEVIGRVTAKIGSLYTDMFFGLTGRIGILNPYFNNLGMDRLSKHNNSNFQLHGVLKGGVKLVGYNATLQGGLFNDKSIYTISNNRVSRLVIDGMAGIVLTYKRIGIEYSKFYLTKEFLEGTEHGWGRCLIVYSF